MSRVDTYQVHVVLAGTDLGLWQTFAGGGVDSEEAFTRDAYGLPRVALGGPATIGNWTVTRTFKVTDSNRYPFIRRQAGKGRCSGSVQLLDADGFAVGTVENYSGILKAASKADVSVEGNEAMKITLEITADGAV